VKLSKDVNPGNRVKWVQRKYFLTV